MGAAASFWHRCTVERQADLEESTGVTADQWATHRTNIPCRLIVKEQRVGPGPFAERAIITTYTLLVGTERDILANDRITSITDIRSGESVESGTFRVDARRRRMLRSARHVSLNLEKVG